MCCAPPPSDKRREMKDVRSLFTEDGLKQKHSMLHVTLTQNKEFFVFWMQNTKRKILKRQRRNIKDDDGEKIVPRKLNIFYLVLEFFLAILSLRWKLNFSTVFTRANWCTVNTIYLPLLYHLPSKLVCRCCCCCRWMFFLHDVSICSQKKTCNCVNSKGFKPFYNLSFDN